MADDKNSTQPKAAAAKPAAKPIQDDDVAGKAYDSRLMRRLLTYLRPYKLQVAISSVATILKAASDSAGPLLVMIAIDSYMAATPGARLSWLPRQLDRLSGHPISSMRGITRVCDVSISTVASLLEKAGEACAAFHDETVRGVKSRRV